MGEGTVEGTRSLQGFLQAGGWFETNRLTGFDANLSARARIAAFAGSPFLHRKGAETRVREATIFFDGSPNNPKDAVDELAGSLLGEIRTFAGFDDLINELSLGHVSVSPSRARRELTRQPCGNHYRTYLQ